MDDWFTCSTIATLVRSASVLNPCPFTLPDTMADVDRRKDGCLERAIGRSFTKRIGMRFGDRELYLERKMDTNVKCYKWRVCVGL